VDFGGLLVLGAVWLLFTLLGRLRGEGRPRPRTTQNLPQTRPSPQVGRNAPAGDPTQQEGSRLERMLRELERNLEQVAAQNEPPRRPPVPAPPLPDDEDVEERESLEEPERVVSLETEVNRPARARYDQDSGAEELVRRRIAAAEARGGAITRADHKRFDARIRQEPADHTAVHRRYTPQQLRNAVVWRELLGPPVSERDRGGGTSA
jgi:hypothetical protein